MSKLKSILWSLKMQNIWWWIFSFIFMLSVAIYQKTTGPTYPIKGQIEIDNQIIKYKLLTSANNDVDARMELNVPSKEISGVYKYKRFKSFDEWTLAEMTREENLLIVKIPKQPAAGKIEYQISLMKNNKPYVLRLEPTVMRFKGVVPLYVLIPHVIFMFLAMVFAVRAGIEALRKGDRLFNQTQFTVIFLFLGGLLLGPIVQKFAFGAYWTGWPFGHDLTDNKTIFAFIFWAIALFQVMKKKPKAGLWVLIATAIMLAIYLIPHSVLGSEIDYTQIPNQ